jgi:hypothetical protein
MFMLKNLQSYTTIKNEFTGEEMKIRIVFPAAYVRIEEKNGHKKCFLEIIPDKNSNAFCSLEIINSENPQ